MTQQAEAYRFFKGHAEDWQGKASDELYSVIQDRHRAVHHCIDKYPTSASLLDIGCGTGQLAIEATEKGYTAKGIDFAEEMIQICDRNRKAANSKAEFELVSIFDFNPQKQYDIISAQGFIEYISLPQLTEFLNKAHDMTAENGSISIGSRNRLFNLCTQNSYTLLENDLGTVETLIKEATLISAADSQEKMIQDLRTLKGKLVQPDQHPLTGIGVKTRYQFTPSDLLHKIESAGFEVQAIYPVHYHGFMPDLLQDEHLQRFKCEIAETVSSTFQLNHRLIGQSSSFVMEARKK